MFGESQPKCELITISFKFEQYLKIPFISKIHSHLKLVIEVKASQEANIPRA